MVVVGGYSRFLGTSAELVALVASWVRPQVSPLTYSVPKTPTTRCEHQLLTLQFTVGLQSA